MLFLFALVFVPFVEDISATKSICNPKAPCGCWHRSPEPKVFGGKNASKGAWSWTISLRNKNGHFCGGSILNEQYVITAAHCFKNETDTLSNIIICAGTNRLNDTCRQLGQIKTLINHPSYKNTSFNNDIALIQVKIPFNFNDTSIARVCLPNITHRKKYSKSGTEVTAVGWGKTETSQRSNTLQQVILQIVDKSENHCDSILNNYRIQLCAMASGKDTCEGDSGGPLMIFTNSNRWELIGITSYGYDCPTDTPGVYTRITAFLTWIQRTIKNTSSQMSNSNFYNITSSNGDHYEGQIKDGKKHGKGTMQGAKGSNYTGNWVEDTITGHGVYTWPDGAQYEGEFKDDKRHGKGTMKYPSGDRYEGEFKDDKMHGVGKMVYANGTVTHGTWLNNELD